MTAATVREPTKKAFHFPKSPEEAAQEPVEAAEPAAAAEKPKAKRPKATSKKATTKKATTKKPAPKKAASKAAKKEAAPASPAEQAPAPETAAKGKTKRAKKEKVVRDSFTMPKTDYERIATLKRKCLEAGVAVKKSELLRAALQLLEASSEKRLLAAIAALEAVKTGRPSKSE